MDIILRKLKEVDIEKVRIWRNSEDVSPYMYNSNKITAQEQLNWFNKIDKDKTVEYWIIEYNGKDLGLAYITQINKTLDSCYWGFYIGESGVRGAGIGGKVEYNVMKYVFDVLKLNKLRCEIFSFNENVIKMHKKFAFSQEAYYREHCLKDNKYIDVVGLAILKSEWKNKKDMLYDKVYKRDK